jgi:hypothetical protein
VKYNLDLVVVQQVRQDKGGIEPADEILYGKGNANHHLTK